MSPLFRNVNCTYKCTKKIKFVDSICNMSPTVAVERMHLVASFMVSTAFFCPSSVAKTTRPDEVLHVNGGSMKIFVDGQRWNEYHLENKERPISTLGRILTKRWEKNHYQKRKTHNILKRNLLLSKKKKNMSKTTNSKSSTHGVSLPDPPLFPLERPFLSVFTRQPRISPQAAKACFNILIEVAKVEGMVSREAMVVKP